ncbi:hypothetical protein [Streptomyces sp. NPDC091027]|uniref:hypothetical protein n=1 Tax=Streptomyces sp. NPDC091027 TaxID=3365971 RepID=UPI00380D9D73
MSDDETVFPAIMPDFDGGVVAEWRAGKRHLAFEVDSFGQAGLSIRAKDGKCTLTVDLNFDQTLYSHLRSFTDALDSLSTHVRMVNPNWSTAYE